MTADSRLALILTFITLAWGSCAAMVGYAWKRRNKRDDEWRENVAETLSMLTITQQGSREWPDRMGRLESALVTLTTTVSELGTQWARHEGYHDAHPR